MNCPSRPDDIEGHPDWNQNPSPLSRDLTTRADLNGMVNLRTNRQLDSDLEIKPKDPALILQANSSNENHRSRMEEKKKKEAVEVSTRPDDGDNGSSPRKPSLQSSISSVRSRVAEVLFQYAKFVGPGFLIAVAYIDPGNYATDVGAGAATKYAHLFVILMSNLFAIFLQSLCIKLGSVTGLNLAENCRKHFPKWLTLILYVFSESAIIATDIAEVIGTAIALNLLLKIPLVAGCAISLIDVLILMVFYNPDGSMTRLRIFEFFVMFLVLGVMVCFCIQLSYIHNTSAAEVFRGYIPSSAVVEGNGIYLSCGILGATVMPHSIFLGSGVVQPRLRQLDVEFKQEKMLASNSSDAADAIDHEDNDDDDENNKVPYRPSLRAIKTGLKYSIVELSTSLFTFALFINSAILIVAGSSLYPGTAATDADLFGIYDLLSSTLGKVAGVLFALALLLSGTSAGIVCTMAGQMVSEGMLNWTIRPWLRRLITRAISIVPSIVIAASIGKDGLNTALTASQVVLSVILPFVTAPLVWFTCRSNIMTVSVTQSGTGIGGVLGRGPEDENDTNSPEVEKVNMRNGWIVTILALAIWLVLVIMNVASLVLVGMGKV